MTKQDKPGMKLYEIEVGATYWAVARNLREVVDLMFQCWEDEGALEDVEGSGRIEIEAITEARADRLTFRDDDGNRRPMAQEAKVHTTPTVIACSEW